MKETMKKLLKALFLAIALSAATVVLGYLCHLYPITGVIIVGIVLFFACYLIVDMPKPRKTEEPDIVDERQKTIDKERGKSKLLEWWKRNTQSNLFYIFADVEDDDCLSKTLEAIRKLKADGHHVTVAYARSRHNRCDHCPLVNKKSQEEIDRQLAKSKLEWEILAEADEIFYV